MTKEPKPASPFANLGRRSLFADNADSVKSSDGGHEGVTKAKANSATGASRADDVTPESSTGGVRRSKGEGRGFDPRQVGIKSNPSEAITKRGRGRPRKAISEQPWEAEGISRALWYRRKSHEQTRYYGATATSETSDHRHLIPKGVSK